MAEETVPEVPAASPPISIDDFARLQLRVGTIRSAEAHPKADRLVVLQVDLGEAQDRQIVAGIRLHVDFAELPGRQIVVVANLAPVKLRGVESQGMLLAATDADGLTLVAPGRVVAPGSTVR